MEFPLAVWYKVQSSLPGNGGNESYETWPLIGKWATVLAVNLLTHNWRGQHEDQPGTYQTRRFKGGGIAAIQRGLSGGGIVLQGSYFQRVGGARLSK